MAYNLYAESTSNINWVHLHRELRIENSEFSMVEYIPAPGMSFARIGADAIFISILRRDFSGEEIAEIRRIILVLLSEELVVSDFYSGKMVTRQNIDKLIAELV